MRILALLLMTLAVTPPMYAGVTIKGDLKVPLYKTLKLTAVSDSKATGFIWYIPGDDKLDVEQLPDGKIRITGPAGTYQIRVNAVNFETKTIDEARVTAVIGDAPVVPVDPVNPVDPVVPPVVPVDDALVKALQTAAAFDTEADKIALAKKLANVYEVSCTDDILNMAATHGQLAQAMQAAAKAAGVSGKIGNIQQAVSKYLSVPLPPIVDVKIDDARKALTKKEFTKVAAALRAIK